MYKPRDKEESGSAFQWGQGGISWEHVTNILCSKRCIYLFLREQSQIVLGEEEDSVEAYVKEGWSTCIFLKALWIIDEGIRQTNRILL